MQNQEYSSKDDNVEKNSQAGDADIKAENQNEAEEKAADLNPEGDPDAKIRELNDKYLRLYSEYDNYRKRTIKEKAEIIRSGGEDVLKAILPIIDDFERAIKANENVSEAGAIKEGFQLIFNKLKNITTQKGLAEFESVGQPFNPDTMEAITHIPATNETQKGIVVDEVEKGYKLGDKVIRFAKVVIAQ